MMKWVKPLVRQEREKFKRKQQPKIQKGIEKARNDKRQQKLLLN